MYLLNTFKCISRLNEKKIQQNIGIMVSPFDTWIEVYSQYFQQWWGHVHSDVGDDDGNDDDDDDDGDDIDDDGIR